MDHLKIFEKPKIKLSNELDVQIIDYYKCLDSSKSSADFDEEVDIYDNEYIDNNSCELPLVIKIFGLLKSGHTITINVIDYLPYFYVKIPDNWDVAECNDFISKLKNKVFYKFKDNIMKRSIVERKPFTEFTGTKKYKFLKIYFKNMNSYNSYMFLFNKKNKINDFKSFQLFEANIDPILKFIHDTNIESAGVIHIKKYDIIYDRTTTTNFEINVKTSDISKSELFERFPINVLSTDIEAGSSHGDFPIGIKNYQKLSQDILTLYSDQIKKKSRFFNVSNARDVLINIFRRIFSIYYNNDSIRNIYNTPQCQCLETCKNLNKYIDTTTTLSENFINTRHVIYNYLKSIFLNENFGDHENLEKIKCNENCKCNCINNNIKNVIDDINNRCQKLYQIKNKIYMNLKDDCILEMINQALDPKWNSFDINNLYTINSVFPAQDKIEYVTDEIIHILKGYMVFLSKGKKENKPSKSNKPNFEPEIKIDIDYFINGLNLVFDSNFPKLEGDPVTQIGSTFQLQGETDCYLKHIICLDTCSDITNDELITDENGDVVFPNDQLAKDLYEIRLLEEHNKSQDQDQDQSDKVNLKDIEKEIKAMTKEQKMEQNKISIEWRRLKQTKTDKSIVKVEYYKTEREVLLAWSKLIQVVDPDIITGYNIFGFDYKFMYERAKENHIEDEFMLLSRLKNHRSQLVEYNLSSSAMGDNKLYYINVDGRINIDLFKVIQIKEKLDSYSLNSVCNKFLYKEKVDLPPQKLFILQRGSPDDRKEICRYCLIDCILCNRLINKLDIIPNSQAMANVCKVPLSYIFIRGQGIKLASIVSYECNIRKYLLPVLENDSSSDGYEGAIVLVPNKGIYYDPIVTLDFNSLYPSSMISENLCKSSFVEINGEFDNLEGYEYNNLTYDTFEYTQNINSKGKKTKKMVKKRTGTRTDRYVIPNENNEKAIIPIILEKLLKARKDTRKEMTKVTDPFKLKVLDGKQLAFKTVANSLYGQLGAKTGMFHKKNVAASTTCVGRSMIIFSKNYVEKEYKDKKMIITDEDSVDDDGNVTKYAGYEIHIKDSICVYGDTDSVFIKFNVYDIKTGIKYEGLDAVFICMIIGKKVAREISAQLKRPQNLDFEKCIYPFVIISKKRYCGHYYTKMAKDSYYLNSMGIVLKRRDNAPIVKHIFGNAIKIIMVDKDVKKAYDFVMTECKKMLKGGFPIEQFIISKTLKSYYKFPDRIAHNVLAKRQAQRDPGNKFSSNDRVPYVFIVNKDPNVKLQGDMIETPDFIKSHNLEIDYEKYLTNQIQVPVSQIFELVEGYENISNDFEKLIRYVRNEKLGVNLTFNFLEKSYVKNLF
jgi:DNA polymerase elongation subunit (family B)